MNITKDYYSTTNFNIGDPVQLDYNNENFVTTLSQVGHLYYKGNTEEIIYNNLLGRFLILGIRSLNNQIIIKCYDREILLWSVNIQAMNIKEIIKFTVGNSGVFVLFEANGIVSVSNGFNADVGGVFTTFLIRFNGEGLYKGYTIIRGRDKNTEFNMGYDYGLNQVLLYGKNNVPMTIGNNKIISKMGKYIFNVILNDSLLTNIITVLDDNEINRLSIQSGDELMMTTSWNGNLGMIFANRLNNYSIVSYNLSTRKFYATSFIYTDYSIIRAYPNVLIAILRTGTSNNWFVFRFNYMAQQLQVNTLEVNGTLIDSDMAVENRTPIIYTLSELDGTIYQLSQYNGIGRRIWSVNNVSDGYISGSNMAVSLYDNLNREITIYTRKLPSLIGIVSSSKPNTNGNYTVTVDFQATKALGPLIPGAEYFVSNDGKIEAQPTFGTYIGTALDKTTLLLKSTI